MHRAFRIFLSAILACAWLFASERAPNFALKEARTGGRFELFEKLRRNRAVLLSFLDTRSGGSAPAARNDSRAQIVFLKSVEEQYGRFDLAVAIIDGSAVAGTRTAPSDLLNFTYDWQLDRIPVLIDEKGAVSKSYGVSSLPTSVLIARDGEIRFRWNGFVPAAALAGAVESVIGRR